MNTARHHVALPSGYKLHWYVIGSVIGQGGFGITYLALDTNLDQRVAIKEFLPTELVTRSKDSQVHPLSADHKDTYGWGLNRFVSEARTLAKFRHPNIVRVLSVFEANRTAYMVMEYERGESLENALRAGRVTGEERLLEIFLPLLDGLRMVHEAGFIHRDIKPDNIYLREDGSPVLLDFGSARRALGVATRTLTALVTPGYAPFEQYDTSQAGEKKQGPWTDIYALGATLYRAITGTGPPDAMARVNAVMGGEDIFVPAVRKASGKASPELLAAIDWALEFLPENRPQRLDDWRAAVVGEVAPPPRAGSKPFMSAAERDAETRIAPDSGPVSDAPTLVLRSAAPSAATTTTGTTVGRTTKGTAASPPEPPGGSAATATDDNARPEVGSLVAEDRIAPPPPRRARDREEDDAPSPWRRVGMVVALALVGGGLAAWYLLTPPPMPVPVSRPAAEAETPAVGSAALGDAERAEAERAEAQSRREAELAARRAEEEARQREAAERARAEAEAAKEREAIARELAWAERDLANDRLTTPADSNAFSRYQAVLAKDPDNQQAKDGLQRIVERYLALTEAALRNDDFDLARQLLDKASGVSPGAESIAAARATVESRRAAFREERARQEAEARRLAEEERRRLEEARRAIEDERRRMEAARLAAEEERQRMEAARQAELERRQREQEEAVLAQMEADFRRAQEISRLLDAAEEDVAAQRFAGPGEENAVARYRAVLALDAENAAAKSGLELVAQHFVAEARSATAAYRFDEAAAALARAQSIAPDAEGLASARATLDKLVAAYDGTQPNVYPPYRFTFLPVAGTHTCTGTDPRPAIDAAGREFVRADPDSTFVPSEADADAVWIASGISKQPHAPKLYQLGREDKLDGALMYWFSAVGVQCQTIHVDVYLVDLQKKRIYTRKGTEADLQELSTELVYEFKKGRQSGA